MSEKSLHFIIYLINTQKELKIFKDNSLIYNKDKIHKIKLELIKNKDNELFLFIKEELRRLKITASNYINSLIYTFFNNIYKII